MSVVLLQNQKVVFVGHESEVRERVEEMFESRLGFIPYLQESTDEGIYQIYLHSDSYEDLADDELEQLQELRITEDPEESTEAIKRLLNVDFQILTIYFAGGMYTKTPGAEPEFSAVRPSGDKQTPYVTLSPLGVKGTEHHALVYKLSEDGNKSILVDKRVDASGRWNYGLRYDQYMDVPKEVNLAGTKLRDDLYEAVKKAVENNSWH